MYISDYNKLSTEYDFRKALDLLYFIDKVRYIFLLDIVDFCPFYVFSIDFQHSVCHS